MHTEKKSVLKFWRAKATNRSKIVVFIKQFPSIVIHNCSLLEKVFLEVETTWAGKRDQEKKQNDIIQKVCKERR